MTICPLASDPHGCFAHRRTSIQEERFPGDFSDCSNCKPGRENAIIAFTPEPDGPNDSIMEMRTKKRFKGPPCPTCFKPRPANKGIRADRPCCECLRTSDEHREEMQARWREAKLKHRKRGRKPRTHCPQGHKYGTFVRKDNGAAVRYCGICNRERVERTRRKKIA